MRSDILIVVAAVVTACLYLLLGLPIVSPQQLFSERIINALSMYFYALPVMFLLFRLRDIRKALRGKTTICWKETVVDFHRQFLSVKNIFIDLKLIFSVVVLFVLVIYLRHLIPFINERIYDQWLDYGESLLFGTTLAEKLVTSFDSKFAYWYAQSYFLYYPYMSLLLFFFIMQRNRHAAEAFFLGFYLLWFIGLGLTYLLPTLGPCYMNPDLFLSLPKNAVTDMQNTLWQMRELVISGADMRQGVNLITAFPSLHVAVLTWGSLCLNRYSNILGVISWFCWVLTMFSTLYFGWHYLIDNLVAVIMAATLYRLGFARVKLNQPKKISRGEDYLKRMTEFFS
ncbi:MAG: phosphatase PAP2 family protein [Deltaproteobacteria bacterium]|nr:phosphatase PAP2 family protein [Deltaproteobacteria bacterium]